MFKSLTYANPYVQMKKYEERKRKSSLLFLFSKKEKHG